MVLEPEYLASPWLDELSGMTYLSYFMKPESAGFKATLDWVNSRLERGITNFTVSFEQTDYRLSCGKQIPLSIKVMTSLNPSRGK